MDDLDNRIRESVEQNKKGRECAEQIAKLALEESEGLSEQSQERYWETLTVLLKHKLPGLARTNTIEPMTPRESRMFGEEEMEFGKYKGKYIDEVPLDYLEFIADAQRLFSTKVRRYLQSQRIKQEQASS